MCENDEMKGKIDKEELLLELSQCREDERNCKNQMVQVISTASTILGPKYMNNVTEGKLLLFYFLLIISPWTLGSMASVAQWVADVVKLKALSIDSYGKKHYIKLAERIEEKDKMLCLMEKGLKNF